MVLLLYCFIDGIVVWIVFDVLWLGDLIWHDVLLFWFVLYVRRFLCLFMLCFDLSILLCCLPWSHVALMLCCFDVCWLFASWIFLFCGCCFSAFMFYCFGCVALLFTVMRFICWVVLFSVLPLLRVAVFMFCCFDVLMLWFAVDLMLCCL